MRIIPAVLVLQLFSLVSFAQTPQFTGPFKYYIGMDDPPAGWHGQDFDDAAWPEGEGGIGYGDVIYDPYYTNTVEGDPPGVPEEGDTLIRTLIVPATGLYLRYPFTMSPEDTVGISGLSLEAFFDDGFIAYLNGAEFARVNMGKRGDTAFFNTLADRSHESQIAAGDLYPVAGYYMSKSFLDEYLVQGENIIAVEVHNDSMDGSDLFFDGALKECLRDTACDPLMSFWHDPAGEWTVNIRTKACVEPDSTDLPLILIESDEFGIPFSHVEVPAHMNVIDRPGGQRNHPSDTSYSYNGRIRIEVRGGSSRYFPKQSFNFETQHTDGSNNNVSLLDMPAENDWKLIGPISDRSLIRHTFTYELGRKQGHWEPRSKFCELILNGEYLGLYALMEKIKPDKNRLDISKLTETDLYGEDVTGGYLFWKLDNWPVFISYPSDSKIQPEQEAYLDTFIERYWEFIFSDNWLRQETDYRNYVNTESMLDYLIVNELAYDHDKYSQSTFMYKDRNDKDSLIHFGPLWDYNYAYGNSSESMATDQWKFKQRGGSQFRRLFQDTCLTQRFAEKWHDQRERFLHTDSLFALIDSLSGHITEARRRDSMVWDAYTTVNVYFALDTVYHYDHVIANLKQWIQWRTEWIDTWIDSIYYPESVTGTESITLYDRPHQLRVWPNPFREELKIELDCPAPGGLYLVLFNPQGQIVRQWRREAAQAGQQSFSLPSLGGIPPGLYHLSILHQGMPAGSARVVRVE